MINSLPIDIDKSQNKIILEIEQWNLLERIKRKDPIPRMKAGAGDAFKNYLRFNDVWKRLKTQQGVVPYSFRHSYSKRAHQIYKSSDTEVAAFMAIASQLITPAMRSGVLNQCWKVLWIEL